MGSPPGCNASSPGDVTRAVPVAAGHRRAAAAGRQLSSQWGPRAPTTRSLSKRPERRHRVAVQDRFEVPRTATRLIIVLSVARNHPPPPSPGSSSVRDLTVTIAGQHPLDVNRWASFLGEIVDVPLRPFTEAEAGLPTSPTASAADWRRRTDQDAARAMVPAQLNSPDVAHPALGRFRPGRCTDSTGQPGRFHRSAHKRMALNRRATSL
jgi:hypothetical protein